MGCSSSAVAHLGGVFSTMAVVDENCQEVSVPLVTKGSTPYQDCFECKKKSPSMMSVNSQCGCCDTWVCSACYKKLGYVSTKLPVPKECSKTKAQNGDNNSSNQINQKYLCPSCLTNCVPRVLDCKIKQLNTKISSMNNELLEKNKWSQNSIVLKFPKQENLYSQKLIKENKCQKCEKSPTLGSLGLYSCIACGCNACGDCCLRTDLATPLCAVILKEISCKKGNIVCSSCYVNCVYFWIYFMTMDNYKRNYIEGFKDGKIKVLPCPIDKNEDKTQISTKVDEKERFDYQFTKSTSFFASLGEMSEVASLLYNISTTKLGLGILTLPQKLYYLDGYYEMRYNLIDSKDTAKVLSVNIKNDVDPNEFIKSDSNEISIDILNMFGDATGLAEIMYSIQLPNPENTPEWAVWYLTKMLASYRNNYYELLCCNADTSYYPGYDREVIKEDSDDRYLPDHLKPEEGKVIASGKISCAFAVIAPQDKSKQEVILILRGTKSFRDWSINLNQEPIEYTYISNNKEVIKGTVHRGMLYSATHLLEVCGLNLIIKECLENEKKISIIGHSLGAGTGALLMMEIKQFFQKNNLDQTLIKNIKCIFFGTPPIVSEDIAIALLKDEDQKNPQIVTLVNDMDIISRVNEQNLYDLANNIIAMEDYINKQTFANLGQLITIGKRKPKTSENSINNGDPDINLENPIDAEEPETEIPRNAETVDESTINNPNKPNGEVDITDKKTTSNKGFVPKEPLKNSKLYIPGKIYHIFQNQNSLEFTLKTGKYDMKSLQRLWPIERGVNQHLMRSYRTALRSARIQVEKQVQVNTEIIKKPTNKFYNNNDWIKCQLCGQDPMWIFKLQTDIDKGKMYRNCAICGKTVCVLCCPAGETVQGFFSGVKLNDRTLVLPSTGLLEPQLVCNPCYLYSYNLKV